MNEELSRIDKMQQEGKITREEADRLRDTLEQEQERLSGEFVEMDPEEDILQVAKPRIHPMALASAFCFPAGVAAGAALMGIGFAVGGYDPLLGGTVFALAVAGILYICGRASLTSIRNNPEKYTGEKYVNKASLQIVLLIVMLTAFHSFYYYHEQGRKRRALQLQQRQEIISKANECSSKILNQLVEYFDNQKALDNIEYGINLIEQRHKNGILADPEYRSRMSNLSFEKKKCLVNMQSILHTVFDKEMAEWILRGKFKIEDFAWWSEDFAENTALYRADTNNAGSFSTMEEFPACFKNSVSGNTAIVYLNYSKTKHQWYIAPSR